MSQKKREEGKYEKLFNTSIFFVNVFFLGSHISVTMMDITQKEKKEKKSLGNNDDKR